MFTTVKTLGRYGRFRTNYVSVPLVAALLEPDEPGAMPRYFLMPAVIPEPEPPPLPAKLMPRTRKLNERSFRPIGEALED